MSTALTRRHVLGLGLAGGIALALSACGDDSDSGTPSTTDPGVDSALEKAAKAEGELTYYSGVPVAAMTPIVDAFTKKYGIKVTVNRQVSAVLATLLTAEVKANKLVVDVIEMSDLAFMKSAADKGWLQTPTEADVPAISGYQRKSFYQAPNGGTTYLQSINLRAISYNTDLVKGGDIPKDWTDLTDPKWKGRIVILDPRNAPSMLALLWQLQQKLGTEFLERLGAQDLKLATSSSNGDNSVAAGEVAFFAPGTPWSQTELINQGAPIGNVTPATVTGATEEWAGLVDNSPHPNAAKLFFNYILSEEGLAVMCKDLCTTARSVQVPGTVPLPAGYETANQEEANQHKAEILRSLGLS